jgi:chemotaxis protein methyltransferase CheR
LNPKKSLEDIEIEILLEGVRRRYGYDFSHYSHASLKCRLVNARQKAGITHFTEMLDLLFHDEIFFDQFLKNMSVTVTDMFRNPQFYAVLREKIIPILKTFPFIKIWHAGCATGEEVYSMAILLHEENFLDRTRIYATDFNKHSLDIAQNAVYPSEKMKTYAENYKITGGKEKFSNYFSDGYGLTKFKDFLKDRITFSYHNLVTDGVFGEMNLIFCRNVLIYFDKELQDRVLSLLSDSLRYNGFLCLGNKETLNFTSVKSQFEPMDARQRIYKKQSEIAHV